MVIYDTKNNNGGLAKGQLHLNVIDIDYIVSKYGIDELSKLIPQDYVDSFQEELNKIKNEHNLSHQYYLSTYFRIDTKHDEKLLYIIQSEIDAGVIFTKKELSEIKEGDLDSKISEILTLSYNSEDLKPDQLYKLRSYKMAQFVFDDFNSCKKLEEISLRDESSVRREEAKTGYFASRNNLIYMGLSEDIYESNYFESKINTYNKK